MFVYDQELAKKNKLYLQCTFFNQAQRQSLKALRIRLKI